MKSTLAILAAIACTMLVQTASANSYPPQTCTGKPYCFPQKFAAPSTNPSCPHGYTLDRVAKKCYKDMPNTCPTGTTPSSDPNTCLSCNAGFKLARDGSCVKPCRSGYSAVVAKGKRYCIKDCDSGYYPYGDKCLSYKNALVPASCTGRCLPSYTYCGSGSVRTAYSAEMDAQAYSSTQFGDAFRAADAAVKSKVEASFALNLNLNLFGQTPCKCVRSYKRDAYEQEVQQAKKTPINQNILYAGAACPNGAAPDQATFTCKAPCPSGSTTTTSGTCMYACPRGFKACTRSGTTFCGTQNHIIGAESCAVLNATWQFVNNNVKCPVPSDAKVSVSVDAGLVLG